MNSTNLSSNEVYIDYYWPIVVLGIMSLLSSMVNGIVLFGDAATYFFLIETFQQIFPDVNLFPGIAKENELRALVLMISLRSLMNNGLMMSLVFKAARWEILKYSMPLIVIFVVIGGFFMDAFGTLPIYRTILGIMFTIFAIIVWVLRLTRMWEQRSSNGNNNNNDNVKNNNKNKNEEEQTTTEEAEKAKETEKEKEKVAKSKLTPEEENAQIQEMLSEPKFLATATRNFAIASPISGFMAATSNVSGPIFMLFILIYSYPRELSKGVVPFLQTTNYVTRLFFTLFLSTDGLQVLLICWRQEIALLIGGQIGVLLGNALAHKMSNATYLMIVATILLLVSLAFIQAPLWILYGALAFCIFIGYFEQS